MGGVDGKKGFKSEWRGIIGKRCELESEQNHPTRLNKKEKEMQRNIGVFVLGQL